MSENKSPRLPSASSWAKLGALALFLLLPACHSGTNACRPEGYPRRLGQRAERFGAFLASRPAWFTDDLEYRANQHARWWDRKTKRFGQEVERTARDGYPHLIDDARSHAPSLGDTVSRWLGNQKDDFTCALDRVWYDMLILD